MSWRARWRGRRRARRAVDPKPRRLRGKAVAGLGPSPARSPAVSRLAAEGRWLGRYAGGGPALLRGRAEGCARQRGSRRRPRDGGRPPDPASRNLDRGQPPRGGAGKDREATSGVEGAANGLRLGTNRARGGAGSPGCGPAPVRGPRRRCRQGGSTLRAGTALGFRMAAALGRDAAAGWRNGASRGIPTRPTGARCLRENHDDHGGPGWPPSAAGPTGSGSLGAPSRTGAAQHPSGPRRP